MENIGNASDVAQAYASRHGVWMAYPIIRSFLSAGVSEIAPVACLRQ